MRFGLRWLAGVVTMMPLVVVADPLKLKSGTFDPLVRMPDVARALRAEPIEKFGFGYVIVQLRSPIEDGDREWIQANGMNDLGYLPDNAIIVRVTPKTLPSLKEWERAAWVGEFHTTYKISPELDTQVFSDPQRQFEMAIGIRRVVITLFEDADPTDVFIAAKEIGIDVLSADQLGEHGWLLGAKCTREQAIAIAKRPEVAFVSNASELKFRNDTTTWVAQSNVLNSRPIWAQGLRGEGQIGAVIDSQVRTTHQMFSDPGGNPIGASHRKLLANLSASGTAASHGTHVCGTIVGDRDAATNTAGANSGHAYEAKLVFRNSSGVSGTNLYTVLQTNHNLGARVHSNSWGDDSTTAYTDDCRAIDLFSRDFEDSLVCFAATNTSALKTPENAKSVLAVGNTSQNPNQGNASTGGAGPTNDGRRKPEVWLPGTGIVSATSSNDTGTASLTGTSMACPAVAGNALLVRQYLVEGRNKVGGVPLSQSRLSSPTGALLRAMLMTSSVDMSGLAGYPGVQEGFGRILLDNVLWFPGDARRTLLWDVRNAQGLTLNVTKTFRFDVTSTSVPLRVTMSFTDVAAAINANPAPVNNLNLEIVAPNGSVYLGNQFNTATGDSVTGGTADAINSSEMVQLLTPQIGRYLVRVKCAALNSGGTQGFALVVNGGVAYHAN